MIAKIMDQAIAPCKEKTNLTHNALEYLRSKYLLRNSQGLVTEEPNELFRRVAGSIAKGETKYGNDPLGFESEFYDLLSRLEFLPSSPVLMSAGTLQQQFSSAYVIPVTSPEATSQVIAKVQASGGGVGYSLNNFVGNSKAELHEMMRLFDKAVLSVRQCGRRIGCNMAVMRVDHPLVDSFVTSSREGNTTNTGTSLLLTDEFMKAAENNEDYDLCMNGQVVGRENASDLLDEISKSSWRSGEPGVVYIDEINRHNPTPQLGKIESISPCAVAPLYPNESAVLGSINLARLTNNEVDFDRLKLVTRTATRFLDDAISANNYPTPETERQSLLTRKVAIGVMGLADVFAKMDLAYGLPTSIKVAESIMKLIHEEAIEASIELAQERGAYTAFQESSLHSDATRNATLTAIAPTGSISVIAGCWGGIEPYYGFPTVHRVLDDIVLSEDNENYYRALHEGRANDIFRSASEVPFEQQVEMVAALQKHVDNSIAKTVTLPNDATVEDVRKTYLQAWKQKCKGITVFRIGSIDGWILKAG